MSSTGFYFLGFLVVGLFSNAFSACDNKSLLCFGYKVLGYCKTTSTHYKWMEDNCPESCGFACPTTTPPPKCDNLISSSYCSSMASKCQTDGYKDYLAMNCKKTCNLCGSSSATTTTPTTNTTTMCGKRGDGYTRIVGGTNAKPGDWPWQVQIDYNRDYDRYWCGGTLLNDEWILSAAHCFEDDVNKRRYDIYLGEHDMQATSVHEQKHEIAELIMHPNYDTNSMNNDLALLRLKKKITYTDFIRPACFPDQSLSFPVGEECFVTGWGYLQSGGSSPRILQQAKIPLVSSANCLSSMGVKNKHAMFCAGYSNKAIDSCQGDSGGPLVCRKQSNGKDKWYLWGVVSWGYDCAKPGFYGVYASTSKLSQWVKNIAF